MSKIDVLLGNIHSRTKALIDSIAKKYSKCDYSGSTPIPNQAFTFKTNNAKSPQGLIFDVHATRILEMIRQLDYEVSVYRDQHLPNITINQPIKFICSGYTDTNGDIIIDDIRIPIIEKAQEEGITYLSEAVKYIAESKPSKEISDDIISRFYSCLQFNDFNAEKSINKPDTNGSRFKTVALLGTTKHLSQARVYEDTSNCFNLSELSDAVMPQIPTRTPIMSGVIALTPRTISVDHLLSKHLNERTSDFYDYLYEKSRKGSLECAVIDYSRNEKTKKNKPRNIYNITYCETSPADAVQEKTEISNSEQPLENIRCIKPDKTAKIFYDTASHIM